MATIRYRSSDLLALRESPLVVKPDELPDIHQWIDVRPPNERTKLRRDDEGENKRPTLTQTRSRTSQSGDLFLGPKISFAAASANRKEGERSISEEYKEKIEKAAREFGLRDWPGERNPNRRDRRDQQNGHLEDGARKNGGRQGSGGDDERPRMKLNRREGPVDEDSQTPRRAGFPEKLNKPWFRGANEQKEEGSLGDRDLRSPMRDSWGKENRHDSKPAWANDPLAPEGEVEAQSQQDFAAWKEMMKKGHAAKESVTKTPTDETFGNVPPSAGLGDGLLSPTSDQPLFGAWGQSNEDELKKPDEPKKMAKPPKKSRFFGGGAPKQEPDPMPPMSPEQPPQQPPQTHEDGEKLAFNNLMHMLRAKGSISQGHHESAFSPPASQPPLQKKKSPTPPAPKVPPGLEHKQRTPDGPPPPMSPQDNIHSPLPPSPKPRPDANSEFLMNLMKHSQPRVPFQEGQIYGQNYNQRREPQDIASLINSVSPHSGKPGRPPPGFYDNQRAFDQNNGIDISQQGPPSHKSPEEHFRPPPNIQPNDHHRGPHVPDFRFPLEPQNFGPHPPGPHHRPPSREGPGPGPPPGFMRPNVPPGFPPFGPSQNGPPPNAQIPPQMRGPPPMQFNGQPPPGFPPGPLPGMGPGQPNGRRMPSGNVHVPPGFEVYGDLQRRGVGPPPMPQSSYAQYLKQGGGPGAYQGM